MSCVKFKEHLFVKGGMDYTIEDCFRLLANYSGIHDFSFDNEFYDDCDDTSAWDTSGAEGTWTSVGGKLQGTGTSGWQFIISNDEVPKAFILTVDHSPDGNERGAVCVLGYSPNNLVYCWWTSTQVGITQRSRDADTNLIVLPKSRSGNRTVTISVQPGMDDGVCFISMWFDRSFQVNAKLENYPAYRHIGAGVYGTDTITFDNFEIVELTEVLEFITMDVGENPLGALKRAIGRRHINYFIRFDGTLRVWRPKAASEAYSFDDEEVYQYNRSIDRRGLISHWRQIGAWDSADAWDTDLLMRVGHKFHKDENPDLMTEEDCETEAEYSLLRSQEYADRIGSECVFPIFIEPEDRIELIGLDWLISDYDIILEAGSLICNLNARKYLYG